MDQPRTFILRCQHETCDLAGTYSMTDATAAARATMLHAGHVVEVLVHHWQQVALPGMEAA